MFCVYAIESLAIKRIYIGHTNHINARLKYHNSGYVKSTAKDRPWRLVALEKVESKDEARWIERSLKKSRGKRVKWIEKNRIKS
jgi:predicted GIY-YIG superfamily endonuclease